MAEDKDRKDAQRGLKAREALENEVFIEAFSAVRAKLLALMEGAKTDEATLRAKLMLGLLADVKLHLERVAIDGKLAAESIRIEAARVELEAKRKRKWFGGAAA